MVGIGNCTVTAGGADDGMIDRATRDPEDTLGEGGEEIGGVEPNADASNVTCARSIKGSNVPAIFARSANRSNRLGKSSGGIDTSGISYSPSRIETTQGWGEASGSIVIYTIAFTKFGTPGIIGLVTQLLLEQIYTAGGSLEILEPMADPKPYPSYRPCPAVWATLSPWMGLAACSVGKGDSIAICTAFLMAGGSIN